MLEKRQTSKKKDGKRGLEAKGSKHDVQEEKRGYLHKGTLLEVVAMVITPEHLNTPGSEAMGGPGCRGSVPFKPIAALFRALTHFPHAERPGVNEVIQWSLKKH